MGKIAARKGLQPVFADQMSCPRLAAAPPGAASPENRICSALPIFWFNHPDPRRPPSWRSRTRSNYLPSHLKSTIWWAESSIEWPLRRFKDRLRPEPRDPLHSGNGPIINVISFSRFLFDISARSYGNNRSKTTPNRVASGCSPPTTSPVNRFIHRV